MRSKDLNEGSYFVDSCAMTLRCGSKTIDGILEEICIRGYNSTTFFSRQGMPTNK